MTNPVNDQFTLSTCNTLAAICQVNLVSWQLLYIIPPLVPKTVFEITGAVFIGWIPFISPTVYQ